VSAISYLIIFLLAAALAFLIRVQKHRKPAQLPYTRIQNDDEFSRLRKRSFEEYRLTIVLDGLERQLFHHSVVCEPIPVLCEDGQVCHVPWLGFMYQSETKKFAGECVAIKVVRIDCGATSMRRRTLQDGEFLEGWMIENGVFALTNNQVAVVNFNTRKAPQSGNSHHR